MQSGGHGELRDHGQAQERARDRLAHALGESIEFIVQNFPFVLVLFGFLVSPLGLPRAGVERLA